MSYLFFFLLIVWVYLLSVLKRSKLTAFHFIVGSIGFFLMLVYISKPFLSVVLTKLVTAGTALFGSLTGIYEAVYQYSLIQIQNSHDTIIMFVDYECSGIIETTAFLALIIFYPIYKRSEKQLLSVIGIVWIYLSNVLRLILISLLVYFLGKDVFDVAHAVIGRLFFYVLTIVLYFNVFTKSEVIKVTIGGLKYENAYKKNS